MATIKKTADQLEREAQRRTTLTPTKPAPPKPAAKTPSKTTAAPAPAPTVPPDWEMAASELYGGYYAIVQSVPELRDLLLKATQQGYSEAQFEYELRQTAWYRQNSASARQWEIASQLDPATAQQSVDSRTTELRNIALNQFQVELGDSILRKLATDSLRFGWNTQDVTNAIGLEATRTTGGMSQLASGFVGQSVRQIANNYGLKLTDENLTQWVGSIATGQQTRDSFQRYAIEQAKQLFPSIAPQLDSGQTFQQIVDPYRNTASRLLEINPTTIDFTDPKWASAITFVDQTGTQRPMSFSEWGNYLRQERSFGYEFTADAQSKAYQVANDLANLFGKV